MSYINEYINAQKSYVRIMLIFSRYFASYDTMTILIVVPQYYIAMISMHIFCCLILFCTSYNAHSSEELNLLEGCYKT